MSERTEMLRQRAREEAADCARRVGQARKTTGNTVTLQDGARRWTAPLPGETVCSRCGSRTGIGCRHTVRA